MMLQLVKGDIHFDLLMVKGDIRFDLLMVLKMVLELV